MHYVFVVVATHISENTVMTEVRGVFAHMHQTVRLAATLRRDGHLVRIQKHQVIADPVDSAVLRFGKARPAFPPVGGVQPVPSSPEEARS